MWSGDTCTAVQMLSGQHQQSSSRVKAGFQLGTVWDSLGGSDAAAAVRSDSTNAVGLVAQGTAAVPRKIWIWPALELAYVLLSTLILLFASPHF
jgi:hypothetical protein